ncbi:MAG: hypothetical protein WCF90_08350 [Methanomicrobiales archaeon]
MGGSLSSICIALATGGTGIGVAGKSHQPMKQMRPLGQGLPQEPQCRALVWRLKHPSAQLDCSAVQVATQLPFWQNIPVEHEFCACSTVVCVPPRVDTGVIADNRVGRAGKGPGYQGQGSGNGREYECYRG